MGNILTTAKNLLSPPAYPPPPDDGSSPPVRDAKELCEEAALNLYIGEIIYASQGSGAAHREDGLAWTREAVDLAEEQLHKLGSSNTASAREAKKTCRECLDSGLGNWAKMAARLAREERERLAAGTPKKSTWLGLWGDGKADAADRWQAEEELVRERMRRAAEVMGEPEVPKLGFMGMFQA
ncbi:hypothetical protein F4780DRAFT_427005 [Xylariomycetidae sp. FL0641]|nr:hypothetical protein F4780DRAFT_427005 [Xylariomycetidae sp. FL0641]